MDISKASNFERFVFDLVGRDPEVIRRLWRDLAEKSEFDLAGTPHARALAESGFVSGKSSHADRLATIRRVAERYRIVVDPHTADGIKVGLERRDSHVPLICIETALPAKFAATIREALGREPERPSAYAHLEAMPQRFDVLAVDTAAVKAYIEARSNASGSA